MLIGCFVEVEHENKPNQREMKGGQTLKGQREETTQKSIRFHYVLLPKLSPRVIWNLPRLLPPFRGAGSMVGHNCNPSTQEGRGTRFKAVQPT